MLVIVMGLLGIPIWFAVGLALCLISRKRMIRNTPGAFPCAVRVRGTETGHFPSKWAKGVGRWERDVFILIRIPALHPFAAIAVDQFVSGDMRLLDDNEIRRMNQASMVLPFRLGSGQLLEIAVEPEHIVKAQGPFETQLPMAA